MYVYVCKRMNMYEYAIICMKMPAHTSCASLFHCLWADFMTMRAEPGSWPVMGMIPVFDKKKAVRAGRPEDGPKSAARRRICVTHQVCKTIFNYCPTKSK